MLLSKTRLNLSKMKFTKKIIYLCVLIVLLCMQVRAQAPPISESNKMRYLKKIERKNQRFVKRQERKTRKSLQALSEKEMALYSGIDSTKMDTSLLENSFSKIAKNFDKDIDAEIVLSKLSKPVSFQKSISIDSRDLSSDIKSYLSKQITTISFLSDSSCSNCDKLKKQTEKVKHNISRTSEKLERLKSIQGDIRKHQEKLQGYGVQIPELAGKIKAIDKSCYYYTQGMNGFKDLYTNPAKGIESNLLKKLSFSKEFKLFQTQFNSLPFSTSSLSGLSGGAPDMTGYQTKAQVQAMLPQNASGIDAQTKAELLSNMQNSLTQFNELKNERPDISLLREKPQFKVNPYKGLPLRKRLVPGFTFQPQLKQVNQPVTIDLGATLGFKLTERLTHLVGASAKNRMGQGHPSSCIYLSGNCCQSWHRYQIDVWIQFSNLV